MWTEPFWDSVSVGQVDLKGQSNEIFYLRNLSQMDSSQDSYLLFKDFSNLASKFDEILAIFDWLSDIIYSRESRLPILFTAKSWDAPHRYSWESLFVRIICINSRKSDNTERRFSPYCLLWRVTTPRLIYSGESLLTAESFFQKQWRTPASFKGKIRQKICYLCSTAHQEHFKRVKNVGWLRLNILFPRCHWQRGVDNLQKTTKILKIPKSLWACLFRPG